MTSTKKVMMIFLLWVIVPPVPGPVTMVMFLLVHRPLTNSLRHCIKPIVNRMHGRLPEPYVYRDYVSLIALGKYSTVGNLMGTASIGSFVVRVVYLSLYEMHQIAIYGYFWTTMLTLSNLFRRSAHVKIKMH